MKKSPKLFKETLKKILPKSFIKAYKKNGHFFYDRNFIQYVVDKKRGLELNKDNIEAIALRGSNADFGFDTREFPNSYNLGLTSTDFFSTYYTFMAFKNSLPKLKYLFVYLSPASIGFELIKTKEKYRTITYQYIFNIPYRYSFDKKIKIEKKIINRCIKLNSSNDKPSSMNEGYVPKEGNHEIIQPAVRAQTHLRENTRTPDQLYWLKELVEAGESKGIKVFLIITPARSDYKKCLPNSNDLFSKIYNNFKLDTILDFYNSKEFSDEDMYDTDHLNNIGAQKLTKILHERIELLQKK